MDWNLVDRMESFPRKLLWWTTFLFFAPFGMMVTLLLIVYSIAPRGRFDRAWFLMAGFVVLDFAAAFLARHKLNRLYATSPTQWCGHWHLSLGDLLSIAIFIALVMTLCRAVAPANFNIKGIPNAMVLGTGYAVALLVLTRFGVEKAKRRWLLALMWLGAVSIVLSLGFVSQFFLLWALANWR